jgi:putative ABC transport system permease protein
MLTRWLAELTQDIRFGVRTLVRNPGFTTASVLTLALATGATTSIFTIVNSVLLRPLPFADPDRLVQVSGVNGVIARSELDAFRSQSTSLEGFTEYGLTTKHLETGAEAERLSVVIVDREFFSVLGAQPMIGRTFRSDDPPRIIVLGARFWNRLFNGNPAIVGGQLTLDGDSFTVLGVMPERFQFPYRAASVLNGSVSEAQTDVWMAEYRPLRDRAGELTARVKPGISALSAASELSAIARRIEFSPPRVNRAAGIKVEPLDAFVLGAVHRSLSLLFGAVALVLVAACANVANLFLALTTARAREVATRAALGAGRLRLVRQFLSESLLLSALGGLGGVLVARWGTSALTGFLLSRVPRAHEIAIDWQVFAFLLLVCLMTAVLFGLAPALTAARADPQIVMKESGGGATAGGRYGRIRDGLVVTEVALAFVLASGVATVIAEVDRLKRTDTGMRMANVVVFHLDKRTTPSTDVRQYYDIADRVAELPGVERAGFTQVLPLQNWGWTGNSSDFTIRSRPGVESQRFSMELRYVSPGYFDALGIPILKGRGFTVRDDRDAPGVILINQTLARRYFGSDDPSGLDTSRGRIVGVVADVQQVRIGEPSRPEIYYPMLQNWSQLGDLGMSLVVRMRQNPESLVDAVRSTVQRVNPGFAVFNIKTMDQVISESLWELNLYRWLVGLFAALALVLAAIGLYGVISYSVAARAREFAVRLALGADSVRLARVVLGRGVGLSVTGMAIGAAATLVLGASVPDLPAAFEPKPEILMWISALLFAIAVGACMVPAIRMARLAPAAALRHD